MHHTYSLHTALLYSFLTLRIVSPEESHETEMYIVTVKEFLATITSYRNYKSHLTLTNHAESTHLSYTLIHNPHLTLHIYIFSNYLYILKTIAE